MSIIADMEVIMLENSFSPTRTPIQFRKRIKPADIILICSLIVFSITLILTKPLLQENPARFVITHLEDRSYEYSLHQNQTLLLSNNGYDLSVVIEDGTVFVQSSNCRDQICVSSKPISKKGEIIVCAPAKISIKLSGEGDDYDAVVR